MAELFHFDCKSCGSDFTMKKSYLTAYRKKHGKDPLYCSAKCMGLGFRADSDKKSFACKNCGCDTPRRRRPGGTIYREATLCSKQCKNEWTSKVYRAKHGSPAITRREKRKYIELRIPASNGEPVRSVLEHRYVMAQHLGRRLRTEETVHHKNGDRHNNDISNLELFSSRHGPGQRVEDKVSFAIEILKLYPEFSKELGFELSEMKPPKAENDRRFEVIVGALSMAA